VTEAVLRKGIKPLNSLQGTLAVVTAIARHCKRSAAESVQLRHCERSEAIAHTTDKLVVSATASFFAVATAVLKKGVKPLNPLQGTLARVAAYPGRNDGAAITHSIHNS
jgi:hypothetical protein